MKRWKSITVGVLFFISPLQGEEDGCAQWLVKTGAIPGTKDCEIKCAVAGVDMGTFTCPLRCREWCKGSARSGNEKCEALRDFAGEMRNTESNRCKSLANIIEETVRESKGKADRLNWVMENLKQVIIGENLTSKRNRGRCFAGQFRGAEGFKSEFRDPFNQIQHAMAGIYIGYKYSWLGCLGARVLEDELQDDLLYEATCDLGRGLNENNLESLGEYVRKTIGDQTCRKG